MRGTTIVTLMGASLLLLAGPLSAQAGGCGGASCGAGATRRPDGGGMMMDEAMMARMDSSDARLDSLVRVLRTARGERRLEAITLVLGQLVDDRLAMRREMHQHMMHQGSAPGGMHRANAAMAPCPMMPPDSTAPPDTGHTHNH